MFLTKLMEDVQKLVDIEAFIVEKVFHIRTANFCMACPAMEKHLQSKQ